MLAVLMINRLRAKRKNMRKKPINPKKVDINDVSLEYCRTCLGTEDLVPIFYSRDIEKTRSDDLKLVTGLEIKFNDGLSQKICMNCVETMTLALQFRFKSINNDRKLKEVWNEDSVGNYDATSTHNSGDLNKEYLDYDDSCELDNEVTTDHDYMDGIGTATQEEQDTSNEQTTTNSAHEYKCHLCDKSYRLKSSYKAHVKYHTNYYICETCGKRCITKSMLLEHKRALHGLERIHLCSYCEFSSATKAALVTHLRRHTGEKPYVCERCGAAFHARDSLKQHLPIHLEDSRYECPICHKRAKSHRLLRQHKHQRHRPRRRLYLCPVCSAVLRSPNAARVHLTRAHAVMREDQGVIQSLEIRPPDETEDNPVMFEGASEDNVLS